MVGLKFKKNKQRSTLEKKEVKANVPLKGFQQEFQYIHFHSELAQSIYFQKRPSI